MQQVQIVSIGTQWGKRFRLQISLPEKVINVRIHACNHCDFIEWENARGDFVATTELSDDFITKLITAVNQNKNRTLPELVQEGKIALGEYFDANNKLLKA